MQLSIREHQADVAVKLCQLHFEHPSLISWHPELLWNTVTFLLSAGNFRSRFVATAVRLAELAMTLNIYPRLTDTKHPRCGLLKLWDFMTQAEIYALLCVYLQSVVRQLGSSWMSLDFKIAVSPRPADMQPPLLMCSADPDMFVHRVEYALVDNLLLSPADFRRTGANEWWVMIEDVSKVVNLLPMSNDVVYKPASAADRRGTFTPESRGSCSVSNSSDRAGSNRKVLLATPSTVQSTRGEEMLPSDTIIAHSMLLTTTSTLPYTPSSAREATRRVSDAAVYTLPMTPQVHLQSTGVRDCNRRVVMSAGNSPRNSEPVMKFVLPPPAHNSSYVASPTSSAVLYPNYQGSVPVNARVAQYSHASPTIQEQFVLYNAYSTIHSISGLGMSRPALTPSSATPGQLSQSIAITSAMVSRYTHAAVIPATTLALFPPVRDMSCYQQLSAKPQPTWASPPVVAQCRMTAAGAF